MKSDNRISFGISFFWLIAMFFLFLTSFSFALNKEFILNAKDIKYLDNKGYIEANGSVEVFYNSTTIESEHILYSSKTKSILTKGKFNLIYQDMIFTGENLNFSFKTKEGSASNVAVFFKNALFFGKIISIEADKITLYDSSFTTCSLGSPHYLFSSQKIILFPKKGLFISYWSVFWINRMPSMFVPIYVYDFKSEEKGRINKLPYPQIGSDINNGAFVSLSLPWYKNEDVNGDISFSFSAKKFFGIGGSMGYKYNDYNEGSFNVMANAKDPISAVLEHSYYLGERINTANKKYFIFLERSTSNQYELLTKLSVNEQLNLEKISMLPNLSFLFNNLRAGRFGFDGKISCGIVKEESTSANFLNSNLIFSIYCGSLDVNVGQVNPRVDTDLSFYSNGSNWLKNIFRIDLNRDWNDFFKTKFKYEHFFANSGASPYRYETYRFNASPKVGVDIGTSIDDAKFGLEVFYNLSDLSPQEIDYILEKVFHCLVIGFKYRATRQEFNLNLMLTQ